MSNTYQKDFIGMLKLVFPEDTQLHEAALHFDEDFVEQRLCGYETQIPNNVIISYLKAKRVEALRERAEAAALREIVCAHWQKGVWDDWTRVKISGR